MNKYNVEKLGFLDENIDSTINLVDEINKLRTQKNAIILAHYYQPIEIQKIADFVGDSLALSQKAANANAKIIVFAGVKFMAETAKILSPRSKVLLPDLNAGCSLADSCKYNEFKEFLLQYPNHKVVSYVNTTAHIKSLSYICCTSSNAIKIVNSIPNNEPIIFAPDKNLGAYIKNLLKRDNMVLWNGACHVHDSFSVERILQLKIDNPNAKIIAHPECKNEIVSISDFVGSTSQILDYSQVSDCNDFIVVTEEGILYEMKKAQPNKNFIPAPPEDANRTCNPCSYMKLTTLKKLYLTLKYELPEVNVDSEIIDLARVPIDRMLKVK